MPGEGLPKVVIGTYDQTFHSRWAALEIILDLRAQK